MKKIKVTKQEFERFISEYKGKLDVDVVMFAEPPVKTYNDFSIGDWPESIVASVVLNESYKKEEDGGVYPYVWSENVYKIKE